jgi:hypothetical protein
LLTHFPTLFLSPKNDADDMAISASVWPGR